MSEITISVDAKKLAKDIAEDIKKKAISLKSHRKPNQSHGKAI